MGYAILVIAILALSAGITCWHETRVNSSSRPYAKMLAELEVSERVALANAGSSFNYATRRKQSGRQRRPGSIRGLQ